MVELREAIERFEVATPEVIEGQQGIFVAPASLDDGLAVTTAARRFLALTETGPDYEAGAEVYSTQAGESGWILEATKRVVDAALADYLTEEEWG